MKMINNSQESQQIYALSDPRDGLIYYVGKSGDAERRFYLHLHGYNGRREKKWIRELHLLGMTPILLILEVIHVGPKVHRTTHERERYWIEEMLRRGQPLLNVHGVTRSFPRHGRVPGS